MISNIYKMSDAEFSVFMENFHTVFTDNKATLGVDTAQIAEVLGFKTGVQGALNEKQAAEELKQAKTANLREKRKNAMKKVAYYNTIFKANEAIPDSLIEQLGFDANGDSFNSLSPQQPTDLVADGFSNGINTLKWKKNGNRPNTVYIIEGRKESEPNFAYAGTTTKTKFDHKNQQPGARMFYRVKAQRNDEESPYSTEAVVY